MEELRQIALAYYKDVPEHMKTWVHEFVSEIDRDGNDKVSLQEFLAYMGMYEDSKHLCTPSFFDELKQEGREELEFPDLLALFYIVSTGRPFCNGHCKNFIKGGYFTCVECFFYSPKSFDLCADCYLDGKYVNHHKNFLDNFLVLKTKKTVGDNLNQHGEASSITSKGTRVWHWQYTSRDNKFFLFFLFFSLFFIIIIFFFFYYYCYYSRVDKRLHFFWYTHTRDKEVHYYIQCTGSRESKA